MSKAYLNSVKTSVPPYDVHQKFNDFAPTLLDNPRKRELFERMASRSDIEHRYSFLKPYGIDAPLNAEKFYRRGHFADTATRMRAYQEHAFSLAAEALDKLTLEAIKDAITHVIVTSCTGFYAPGLDLQIVNHYGLRPDVERTMIGFMGCYAAFNALKLARHIVRSDPESKVLIVNLELCTLHLQETDSLAELLSFLIFADGCAASIVSSEPTGVALESFYSTVIPDSGGQITWEIGGSGFDMVLSGKVPLTIAGAVPPHLTRILDNNSLKDIRHWAIHPGGRSVLDTVQKSFDLSDAVMQPSRNVLRDFGNMSSATVMFVFKDIIEARHTSALGCALAFGPGVTLESMLFTTTGA